MLRLSGGDREGTLKRKGGFAAPFHPSSSLVGACGYFFPIAAWFFFQFATALSCAFARSAASFAFVAAAFAAARKGREFTE